MNKLQNTDIARRIHAAIRPQLDRCDALLDHYLQDAPREVWEPIMQQLTGTPATTIDDALDAFHDALQHPSMIADLTIMGLL